MVVFAWILGIMLGTSIAFYIVGQMVNKSNNKGDSKGTYYHFAKGNIVITEKIDRHRQKIPLH